mmetsp:Transcript_44606/g.94852  ORF Transcript_44606/g.94852 Transcript_44606/m.94852 type:complete len:207 (+) Transcript_44606:170-790(+)
MIARIGHKVSSQLRRCQQRPHSSAEVPRRVRLRSRSRRSPDSLGWGDDALAARAPEQGGLDATTRLCRSPPGPGLWRSGAAKATTLAAGELGLELLLERERWRRRLTVRCRPGCRHSRCLLARHSVLDRYVVRGRCRCARGHPLAIDAHITDPAGALHAGVFDGDARCARDVAELLPSHHARADHTPAGVFPCDRVHVLLFHQPRI